MAEFTVGIMVDGAKELRVAYDAAPALIASTLVRRLTRCGLIVRKSAQSKMTGPGQLRRTGTLSRALFSRLEVHRAGADTDALVRVGASLKEAPQARALELGGTIRAVKARYLTIPLAPILTSQQQVAKGTAREFMESRGKGFGFVSAWFYRKGGSLLIMGQPRKNGPPQAVFALVKSIELKPVGYLARSLADSRGEIEAELGGAVTEVIQRMPAGSKGGA